MTLIASLSPGVVIAVVILLIILLLSGLFATKLEGSVWEEQEEDRDEGTRPRDLKADLSLQATPSAGRKSPQGASIDHRDVQPLAR